MDRWGNLNMQQKAQLLGIYASKGYTDLASIINHYNTFQTGGRLTFSEWKSQMQSKYPDIEMDNTKAGYDYVKYFNDNYDEAIRQLSELRHFPDTYKLPNHKTFSNESIYSRSPMMGGSWINDSTFFPSIINRQQYPDIYKEDRPYTEREIYGNDYQQGGSLGKVTPLGQWEYPHQVTTIPSNNITMKGVDYPVLGVSDTGDTKYMLPDKDYLFDGQYVTEYPVKKFQLGGITTGSYPTYNVPFSDTDDHTWLKWWYSGRTNQIGNAYREYDISYNKNKKPKFLNKYNETGLNDINRNIDIAMKTPINFASLRDNTLLGQYIPEGKAHIDIRRDQENHPSTVLHERIHALNENLTGAHHVKSILGNFLQNPILMQISPETGTVDYREKLNGYVDSYWDNSNEIYSRLMQFRRDTRTNPLKKWNEEDVINLRKNKTLEKYNLDGYTNEFILHLFNDVADNNNKDYSTLV